MTTKAGTTDTSTQAFYKYLHQKGVSDQQIEGAATEGAQGAQAQAAPKDGKPDAGDVFAYVFKHFPEHQKQITEHFKSLGLDLSFFDANGNITPAKLAEINQKLSGGQKGSLRVETKGVNFPKAGERISDGGYQSLRQELVRTAFRRTDLPLLSIEDQEKALLDFIGKQGLSPQQQEQLCKGLKRELNLASQGWNLQKKISHLATLQGRENRDSKLLQAAIEVDPKNAEGHRLVGTLFLKDGKGEQAKAHFALAIQHAEDPKIVESISKALEPGKYPGLLLPGETRESFIGDQYFATGRYDLAKETYERGLKEATDPANKKFLEERVQWAEEKKQPYEKGFDPQDNPQADYLFDTLRENGIPAGVLHRKDGGNGAERKISAAEIFQYVTENWSDPRVQSAVQAAQLEIPKQLMDRIPTEGLAKVMGEYHLALAGQLKQSGGDPNAQLVQLVIAGNYLSDNAEIHGASGDLFLAQGRAFEAVGEFLQASAAHSFLNTEINQKLTNTLNKAIPETVKAANERMASGDNAGAKAMLGPLFKAFQEVSGNAVLLGDAWATARGKPAGVGTPENYRLMSEAAMQMGTILDAENKHENEAVPYYFAALEYAGSTLSPGLQEELKKSKETAGDDPRAQFMAELSLDLGKAKKEDAAALMLRSNALMMLSGFGAAHAHAKKAAELDPQLKPRFDATVKTMEQRVGKFAQLREGLEKENPPNPAAIQAYLTYEIEIHEALGHAEKVKELSPKLKDAMNGVPLGQITKQVNELAAKGLITAEGLEKFNDIALKGPLRFVDVGVPAKVSDYVILEEKAGKTVLKFNDAFKKLSPGHQLMVMRGLHQAGMRANFAQLASQTESPIEKLYFQTKVQLLDGNLPAVRLGLMKLKEETKGLSDPEGKAIHQQVCGELRMASLQGLQEASGQLEQLKAAREIGGKSHHTSERIQYELERLNKIEGYLQEGTIDTLEEGMARLDAEQAALAGGGSAKKGERFTLTIPQPRKEDKDQEKKLADALKKGAIPPNDLSSGRGSGPYGNIPRVKVDGGMVDVPTYAQGGPSAFAVVVGKEGGTINLAGRAYTFHRSEGERVVLFRPGFQEYNASNVPPDPLGVKPHQFGFSDAKKRPQDIKDPGVDRLLQFQTKAGLEKIRTPEGLKQQRLEAARLFRKSGDYAMAGQIFEAVIADEVEKAYGKISPQRYEEIKRRVNGDEKVAEQAREQIEEIKKDPKAYQAQLTQFRQKLMMEKGPAGVPQGAALEQAYLAASIQAAQEGVLGVELRKIAMEEVGKAHDAGQISDSSVASAWEDYDNMMDPTGNNWAPSDEAWDAMVQQTVIMAAISVVTLGAGTAIQAGLAGTRAAMSLAALGTGGRAAAGVGIYLLRNAGEAVVQTGLEGALLGQTITWRRFGYNLANQMAFHGVMGTWAKTGGKLGEAGAKSLASTVERGAVTQAQAAVLGMGLKGANLAGMMAVQSTVGTVGTYAEEYLFDMKHPGEFWDRWKDSAKHMTFMHFGMHGLNVMTGNRAAHAESLARARLDKSRDVYSDLRSRGFKHKDAMQQAVDSGKAMRIDSHGRLYTPGENGEAVYEAVPGEVRQLGTKQEAELQGRLLQAAAGEVRSQQETAIETEAAAVQRRPKEDVEAEKQGEGVTGGSARPRAPTVIPETEAIGVAMQFFGFEGNRILLTPAEVNRAFREKAGKQFNPGKPGIHEGRDQADRSERFVEAKVLRDLLLITKCGEAGPKTAGIDEGTLRNYLNGNLAMPLFQDISGKAPPTSTGTRPVTPKEPRQLPPTSKERLQQAPIRNLAKVFGLEMDDVAVARLAEEVPPEKLNVPRTREVFKELSVAFQDLDKRIPANIFSKKTVQEIQTKVFEEVLQGHLTPTQAKGLSHWLSNASVDPVQVKTALGIEPSPQQIKILETHTGWPQSEWLGRFASDPVAFTNHMGRVQKTWAQIDNQILSCVLKNRLEDRAEFKSAVMSHLENEGIALVPNNDRAVDNMIDIVAMAHSAEILEQPGGMTRSEIADILTLTFLPRSAATDPGADYLIHLPQRLQNVLGKAQHDTAGDVDAAGRRTKLSQIFLGVLKNRTPTEDWQSSLPANDNFLPGLEGPPTMRGTDIDELPPESKTTQPEAHTPRARSEGVQVYEDMLASVRGQGDLFTRMGARIEVESEFLARLEASMLYQGRQEHAAQIEAMKWARTQDPQGSLIGFIENVQSWVREEYAGSQGDAMADTIQRDIELLQKREVGVEDLKEPGRRIFNLLLGCHRYPDAMNPSGFGSGRNRLGEVVERNFGKSPVETLGLRGGLVPEDKAPSVRSDDERNAPTAAPLNRGPQTERSVPQPTDRPGRVFQETSVPQDTVRPGEIFHKSPVPQETAAGDTVPTTGLAPETVRPTNRGAEARAEPSTDAMPFDEPPAIRPAIHETPTVSPDEHVAPTLHPWAPEEGTKVREETTVRSPNPLSEPVTKVTTREEQASALARDKAIGDAERETVVTKADSAPAETVTVVKPLSEGEFVNQLSMAGKDVDYLLKMYPHDPELQALGKQVTALDRASLLLLNRKGKVDLAAKTQELMKAQQKIESRRLTFALELVQGAEPAFSQMAPKAWAEFKPFIEKAKAGEIPPHQLQRELMEAGRAAMLELTRKQMGISEDGIVPSGLHATFSHVADAMVDAGLMSKGLRAETLNDFVTETVKMHQTISQAGSISFNALELLPVPFSPHNFLGSKPSADSHLRMVTDNMRGFHRLFGDQVGVMFGRQGRLTGELRDPDGNPSGFHVVIERGDHEAHTGLRLAVYEGIPDPKWPLSSVAQLQLNFGPEGTLQVINLQGPHSRLVTPHPAPKGSLDRFGKVFEKGQAMDLLLASAMHLGRNAGFRKMEGIKGEAQWAYKDNKQMKDETVDPGQNVYDGTFARFGFKPPIEGGDYWSMDLQRLEIHRQTEPARHRGSEGIKTGERPYLPTVGPNSPADYFRQVLVRPNRADTVSDKRYKEWDRKNPRGTKDTKGNVKPGPVTEEVKNFWRGFVGAVQRLEYQPGTSYLEGTVLPESHPFALKPKTARAPEEAAVRTAEEEVMQAPPAKEMEEVQVRDKELIRDLESFPAMTIEGGRFADLTAEALRLGIEGDTVQGRADLDSSAQNFRRTVGKQINPGLAQSMWKFFQGAYQASASKDLSWPRDRRHQFASDVGKLVERAVDVGTGGKDIEGIRAEAESLIEYYGLSPQQGLGKELFGLVETTYKIGQAKYAEVNAPLQRYKLSTEVEAEHQQRLATEGPLPRYPLPVEENAAKLAASDTPFRHTAKRFLDGQITEAQYHAGLKIVGETIREIRSPAFHAVKTFLEGMDGTENRTFRVEAREKAPEGIPEKVVRRGWSDMKIFSDIGAARVIIKTGPGIDTLQMAAHVVERIGGEFNIVISRGDTSLTEGNDAGYRAKHVVARVPVTDIDGSVRRFAVEIQITTDAHAELAKREHALGYKGPLKNHPELKEKAKAYCKAVSDYLAVATGLIPGDLPKTKPELDPQIRKEIGQVLKKSPEVARAYWENLDGITSLMEEYRPKKPLEGAGEFERVESPARRLSAEEIPEEVRARETEEARAKKEAEEWAVVHESELFEEGPLPRFHLPEEQAAAPDLTADAMGPIPDKPQAPIPLVQPVRSNDPIPLTREVPDVPFLLNRKINVDDAALKTQPEKITDDQKIETTTPDGKVIEETVGEIRTRLGYLREALNGKGGVGARMPVTVKRALGERIANRPDLNSPEAVRAEVAQVRKDVAGLTAATRVLPDQAGGDLLLMLVRGERSAEQIGQIVSDYKFIMAEAKKSGLKDPQEIFDRNLDKQFDGYDENPGKRLELVLSELTPKMRRLSPILNPLARVNPEATQVLHEWVLSGSLLEPQQARNLFGILAKTSQAEGAAAARILTQLHIVEGIPIERLEGVPVHDLETFNRHLASYERASESRADLIRRIANGELEIAPTEKEEISGVRASTAPAKLPPWIRRVNAASTFGALFLGAKAANALPQIIETGYQRFQGLSTPAQLGTAVAGLALAVGVPWGAAAMARALGRKPAAPSDAPAPPAATAGGKIIVKLSEGGRPVTILSHSLRDLMVPEFQPAPVDGKATLEANGGMEGLAFVVVKFPPESGSRLNDAKGRSRTLTIPKEDAERMGFEFNAGGKMTKIPDGNWIIRDDFREGTVGSVLGSEGLLSPAGRRESSTSRPLPATVQARGWDDDGLAAQVRRYDMAKGEKIPPGPRYAIAEIVGTQGDLNRIDQVGLKVHLYDPQDPKARHERLQTRVPGADFDAAHNPVVLEERTIWIPVNQARAMGIHEGPTARGLLLVLETEPFRFPRNQGLKVEDGDYLNYILPAGQVDMERHVPGVSVRLNLSDKASFAMGEDRVQLTFDEVDLSGQKTSIPITMSFGQARKLGVVVSADGRVRVEKGKEEFYLERALPLQKNKENPLDDLEGPSAPPSDSFQLERGPDGILRFKSSHREI